MASPPPTLGAGVEEAQIALLYIRSFVYYICVHLLNIYRTISQNNTIGYSNAELLSGCACLWNSKRFSSSSSGARGGGLPIFGLFASDFTHPLKEGKVSQTKQQVYESVFRKHNIKETGRWY